MFFERNTVIKYRFKYNNTALEDVNEFTYLGGIFSRTGSFAKARKAQTLKVIYAVHDDTHKGRNIIYLCQLDLVIKLSNNSRLAKYKCEVWGIGNNSVIERVHLKFCKTVKCEKKLKKIQR